MKEKNKKRRARRLWTLLALVVLLAVYVVTGVIRSEFLESTLISVAVPSQSGVAGELRVCAAFRPAQQTLRRQQ